MRLVSGRNILAGKVDEDKLFSSIMLHLFSASFDIVIVFTLFLQIYRDEIWPVKFLVLIKLNTQMKVTFYLLSFCTFWCVEETDPFSGAAGLYLCALCVLNY